MPNSARTHAPTAPAAEPAAITDFFNAPAPRATHRPRIPSIEPTIDDIETWRDEVDPVAGEGEYLNAWFGAA